jgi:AsmA protein
LAGSSVNLGSLLEEWPAASAGGQWSHESFPAAHLSAADLDLRFSASHVAIGDLNFDDAALSVLLKNGRLDLSLAEASAYSGDLRARAVVSESGGGLDIRGSVNAEKIDSASLLWDGFKSQSLSGAANLAATFETSGENFYELASRLDARGEFSVAAGEIYGIDLGLAFRRMEKRPLTAGVNLRSGRTGFETLAAKFSVVLGVAEIEEGVARNPRLSVFFSGRANVADRTLDLHATARGEPAGERAPAQLGFAISGGWDDPSIAPDAEGLIRRSDAAAPLLPKPAPE